MVNINHIHDEDDEVPEKFDHESNENKITEKMRLKTKEQTIQAASSDSITPFHRIITMAKINVSHISSRISPSPISIR